MKRFSLTALAVSLTILTTHAADDKPAATDPNAISMRQTLGDIAGIVVDISATSVKIKYPQPQQSSGRGRNRNNNTAPKYIEQSYDIAEKATVTFNGKTVNVADIKNGDTVSLHVTNHKTGKVGEKLDSHVEVSKIVIINHGSGGNAGNTPKTTPKK